MTELQRLAHRLAEGERLARIAEAARAEAFDRLRGEIGARWGEVEYARQRAREMADSGEEK